MEAPGLVSCAVSTPTVSMSGAATADGFCAGHFGEAEIQNFGVATFGDENIGGLDVAMHDAFAVRGVEGVGHLDGKIENVVQLHGADRRWRVSGFGRREIPWR